MAIVLSTASRRSDFDVFRSRNAAFAERLPALRSYRDHRLASLTEMTGRERRSMVRDILTDMQLLRLYTYEGLRRSKGLRAATVAQIEEAASSANLFAGCGEKTFKRPVRSHRRMRDVFKFGPQKRTRQLLVADVIQSLHPPHDSQKLFHGGMPAARSAVEAAYSDGGMRYCAEVDFIDFYGSVPLDVIAETLRPLPMSVVRHVVYDRTIRHSCEDDSPSGLSDMAWSDPHRIGPVGLPLGSACSPIVGECILARYLSGIPSDQFVAYADNILLFGRNAEDVRALTESLSESLQDGSGSMRLRVRVDQVSQMSSGFEFLGQEASIDEVSGKFSWRPTFEKLTEYRIGDWVFEATNAQIDEAEAKIVNWRSAYPDWDDGDAVEAQALAEIACLRYFKQKTRMNLRRAVSASIDALLANRFALALDEIVPDPSPEYARTREKFLAECLDRIPDEALLAHPDT